MSAYDVLSERELEPRYEVFVEQYMAKLNIEAETTFSMAKTMLLPAAVRYLGELGLAGDVAGIATIRAEVGGAGRRVRRARSARWGRRTRATPRTSDVLAARQVRQGRRSCRRWRRCARSPTSSSAWCPDTLWPLPKYSEILFIK